MGKLNRETDLITMCIQFRNLSTQVKMPNHCTHLTISPQKIFYAVTRDDPVATEVSFCQCESMKDIHFDRILLCSEAILPTVDNFCNSWQTQLTCYPLSYDRKGTRTIQMYFEEYSQSNTSIQAYNMHVRLGNNSTQCL